MLCLIHFVIINVVTAVVRSYFLFFGGVTFHVASHGVGAGGLFLVSRAALLAVAAGVIFVDEKTVRPAIAAIVSAFVWDEGAFFG